MGRRGKDRRKRKRRPGKIRGSAAEPQVRECLERGGTLKEASEVFKESTGESVSLDALSRYCREVRAEAEQVREVGHQVAAMVREEDDFPGCYVTVLARKLLMFRAMEAVRQLPEESFEGLSADRLSLIISRLEREGALTDRNRVGANDLYAVARGHVLKEGREEFDGNLDLREQFNVIWEERRRRKEGKSPRKVEVVVREYGEEGPVLEPGAGEGRAPGPGAPGEAKRSEEAAPPEARKPEAEADSSVAALPQNDRGKVADQNDGGRAAARNGGGGAAGQEGGGRAATPDDRGMPAARKTPPGERDPP